MGSKVSTTDFKSLISNRSASKKGLKGHKAKKGQLISDTIRYSPL